MSENETGLINLPATEDAVRWAYRLILGREPESEQIVAAQSQANADVESLRRGFLRSPEFIGGFSEWFRLALLRQPEPPIRIDCDGTPQQLDRLFEHVSRSWRGLGDEDPFYSVATAREYRGMPAADVVKKFFESGVGDVQTFFERTGAKRPGSFQASTCLEFGCGLGRMTQALAPHFQKTIGVDISSSHLAQARKLANQANIGGIEWKQLSSVAALHELPQVDVVYSMIVLQHNPPPVIDRIVATFARLLKPGGIAYFQVPTYRSDYSFDLQKYLDSQMAKPGMEMHVYPQDRVFRHFIETGSVPISVTEDDATGVVRERSNTFLFLRKK